MTLPTQQSGSGKIGATSIKYHAVVAWIKPLLTSRKVIYEKKRMLSLEM